MEFDQIDYSNMPTERDSAFIHIESQLRRAYEEESKLDRDKYMNQDGDYVGECEPARTYVSGVLALLDELSIHMDVADISNYSWDNSSEFNKEFSCFRQQIGRTIFRFKMRNARMDSGIAGTVIQLQESYKIKIGRLLQTIRKIVNQEIKDANKRDKIFRKMSSLQSEVDRDVTTTDMLFRRIVELSETIGECVENLEPLVEKLERLGGLLVGGSKRVKALPDRDYPKLVEDKTDNENQSSNLDNEVF